MIFFKNQIFHWYDRKRKVQCINIIGISRTIMKNIKFILDLLNHNKVVLVTEMEYKKPLLSLLEKEQIKSTLSSRVDSIDNFMILLNQKDLPFIIEKLLSIDIEEIYLYGIKIESDWEQIQLYDEKNRTDMYHYKIVLAIYENTIYLEYNPVCYDSKRMIKEIKTIFRNKRF